MAYTKEKAIMERITILDRIRGINIRYSVAYDWESILREGATASNLRLEYVECASEKCTASEYPILLNRRRIERMFYRNIPVDRMIEYCCV